jgi:hypothetical protein
MNTGINLEWFFYFITLQSVRSGQILLFFSVESLMWRLAKRSVAKWSVAVSHFWKFLRKCLMTQLGEVAPCCSPLAVMCGIDKRRQYKYWRKVKALVILTNIHWRSRGRDCRSPSIILSTEERWVVCFTLRRSLCLFRVIISCCTSNSELYRSGGIKLISRSELLISELLRISMCWDGFALQIGIAAFGRTLGLRIGALVELYWQGKTELKTKINWNYI